MHRLFSPARASVITALAASAIASLAPPVTAQMTIVESNRRYALTYQLDFSASGQSRTTDHYPLGNTGMWKASSGTSISSIGSFENYSVRLRGVADSLITTQQITGTNRVETEVTDDPGGATVFGRAYNRVGSTFQLTDATDILIDVTLARSGSPNAYAGMQLFAGDALIFAEAALGNTATVNRTFHLGPGIYTFEMLARVESTGGPTDQAASFDGGLYIVPSPTTTAALALAGLAATRRRRG